MLLRCCCVLLLPMLVLVLLLRRRRHRYDYPAIPLGARLEFLRVTPQERDEGNRR